MSFRVSAFQARPDCRKLNGRNQKMLHALPSNRPVFGDHCDRRVISPHLCGFKVRRNEGRAGRNPLWPDEDRGDRRGR